MTVEEPSKQPLVPAASALTDANTTKTKSRRHHLPVSIFSIFSIRLSPPLAATMATTLGETVEQLISLLGESR